MQFVDARDLGEWIVRATEKGLSGIYNATGETITFEQLLEACQAVSAPVEIAWVPSEALVEAGVGEWMELPLWIAALEVAAMQRADVSKATEAGLSFRPLADTIADTLAWDAQREFPRAEGVGLTPERERELLAGA